VKQVFIRGGGVVVDDVPAPAPSSRSILVGVHHSCVSIGTELAGLQLSAMPLYRRALKQPHHAKRALELARDQGFARTYKRISGRLAAGIPTGYSAAGVVVGVGDDVAGFAVGDRVACAGSGIANHAELIAVPVQLAVKVPAGLALEDACTVTLGAIALQGIRRLEPTLGEIVGVIGLGVIGQLTVQLLRAHGCRVLATDIDPSRCELAVGSGATWFVLPGDSFPERALGVSDGFGLDGVVITAATPSSTPISEAFQACRKKGRVVLVGDVGLDLKRHEMYEKELDLRISTSYGPGRYDAVYEEDGHDYPIGYVRWTEGRNLEEYLKLLAEGRVTLAKLPRETYPVDHAPAAYDSLKGDGPKAMLVVLAYSQSKAKLARTVRLRAAEPAGGRIRVALVGAGSFAEATHIPNLLKLRSRFQLRAVMSRTGASAKAFAERNQAAYATTDYGEILADPEVDLVLITTRHDLHSPLALRALEAGKNVFVEKPLAIDEEGLAAIEAFYAQHDGPLLMTGFNRRFAPTVARARELVAGRTSPLVVDYRMNAGYIELGHWVHGPEGGGRNIGEACHVYDVFDALAGAEAISVSATAVHPASKRWARNDNFIAVISYADGSICALTYTALGHRDHPKERMEVYVDGAVLSLDDYRSLDVVGRAVDGVSSRSSDKGHRRELEELAGALLDGQPWPISLEEQVRATRISFEVERKLRGDKSPC
jgi:predicted dehydrogenase/threonine dehydrogenase-like Zn-dependent dehydrogenase